MIVGAQWKKLGWRHPVWELLRYYNSLRGGADIRESLMNKLITTQLLEISVGKQFKINERDTALLLDYLAYRRAAIEMAQKALRSEELALRFCEQIGAKTGQIRTKSKYHHQSSNALYCAVSRIAEGVCKSQKLSVDCKPQRRCVWCVERGFHITARNLDGAIPSLANPNIIWEIKEYWGKTAGGSKMSDAVYECHLVGRELREFEERVGITVSHVVFVDGLEQWNARKSDLGRLIDLNSQGLIDHLFIGIEVESQWKETLIGLLKGIP